MIAFGKSTLVYVFLKRAGIRAGAGAGVWAWKIAGKGVGVLLPLVGTLGRSLASSSSPPGEEL